MQMALAVILDGVAAAHDLAGQARVSGDPLADAEEGALAPCASRSASTRRGDLRIRAIVDGDGDRGRPPAQAGSGSSSDPAADCAATGLRR